MSYNGSGVFQRLYSWATDKTNNVKIQAARMDGEDDGFATGLSNVICRDGQSTISADIPWNGKKITGLGNAAADADALNRITGDGRYVLQSPSTITTVGAHAVTLTFTNTTGVTFPTTGTLATRAGAETLTNKVIIETPVTVTDGAGAVINASLGNIFNWTAAADRTAGTTTNSVSGQKLILNFTASGAARTLTLPTATTGDFAFGSDITALTQTASGKTDLIGCVYNTVKANRWAVVAYVKGY